MTNQLKELDRIKRELKIMKNWGRAIDNKCERLIEDLQQIENKTIKENGNEVHHS